ncbi:MAG: ParB N-terminal domain-containing protein [Candidatus Thorarchaeota archaeon]
MDENIIKHKCIDVEIVPLEMLIANDYNPNRMPDVEMNMLKDCIVKYGFLFPIITTWVDDLKKYRIIDGYHRYEVLKRIGAKDVAILNLNLSYHDAVQLTVLMNRIKGLHQVELMSDLIVKLEDLGVDDEEICNNLGMEAEEYIRLKQQLGISHAFRNHKYTNAWEIKE